MAAKQKPSTIQPTVNDGEVVDECEILDYNWEAPRSKDTKWEKSQAFGAFSSHGGVEMAKDNKTPLRIKDGKFGESIGGVCLLSFAFDSLIRRGLSQSL